MYIHNKMKQKITIEVQDEHVLSIIKDLEALRLIKVIPMETLADRKNLAKKYKGVFSKCEAKSFNEHTEKMRAEWSDT